MVFEPSRQWQTCLPKSLAQKGLTNIRIAVNAFDESGIEKFEIVKVETTSAKSISDTGSASKKEVARYSVNGMRLQKPEKGVNIVKYSDGTAEKVVH